MDALGAGRHLIVADIGRSDSDVIVIDTMKLLMMENENDNGQILSLIHISEPTRPY